MDSIKRTFLYLSIVIFFGACGDDFLTLTPKSSVTESGFFITEEDAWSALAGVYATLQDEAAFSNVRNAADIE